MSRPDVPIRDAASVVLLREGAGGLEAWLILRVSGMTFAGGMTVFPGGRVDPSDADLPFGPAPWTDLATRLDADEATTRALVGAAVRETFEETGVLLTTPSVDLGPARAEIEAGKASFGDLLRANGLVVDPARLRPWSRWVTPPGESRRYDTRFFVAALPAGGAAHDVTSESERAGWLTPAVALAERERGIRPMLPPTVVTLTALAAFTTVAEVFAAASAQSLAPIGPSLHTEGDTVFAELADGTRYPMPDTMFR